MKIAIAGAGFAGLSVAWHLAHHAKKACRITVFDPTEGFGSASSAAAGLMHPFSGKKGKLAKWGREAFQESCRLFNEVKPYQKENFILHRGMIRLAMNKEQEEDYKRSLSDHPSLRWFEKEEAQSYFPLLAPLSGLFVEEALAIDSVLYLDALKEGLKRKGVLFIDRKIESVQDFAGFDAAVAACGFETPLLIADRNIPFRYLKGQGMEFELPDGVEPFECAINGDLYAVMLKGSRRFFLGATFERGNSDPRADPIVAEEKIYPKIQEMMPALAKRRPVRIRSHVRLTTSSHFPVYERVEGNLWVFSGLGSKGLLYHALLGKKIASEIEAL